MYLYCGATHPLYDSGGDTVMSEQIRACKYVGIGYHSPNMEVTHQLGQQRDATAYDQEAVAHLVLSGRYVGYLPAHYAAEFERQALMRPLLPAVFEYVCQFSAIVRHAPQPNRIAHTFLQALTASHSTAPYH